MSTPDRSIDPRLLASARTEFKKNGFIKAELKTICDNAGVTTGAVYKRYKGKEDLFCAVVAEVSAALTDFINSRSDVDFSGLSDREVHDSWVMTFEAVMPMFRMLYRYRDDFSLLISKAAGTRYENFNHEFVDRMSYAYEQYYSEAKKRGLVGADITREEFHILISSFWTCICEPFVHEMTFGQMEEHCRLICRFFNWEKVIMLKKPR